MEKILKTKISFGDKYKINNNSMDIIRLFLSILVIYGHTFPILYGPSLVSPSGKMDFLATFSNNQIGSGTVAVYIFFILSGFLISQSMLNSNSCSEYLIKRGLRLLPAYFCSLIMSTLILGPIVSNYKYIDYIKTGDPFKYIIHNITFGIFGFHYSLVDVYSNNPFPSSINASMWTLPYEVACYLMILLFAVFGILSKKERFLAIFIISLLFAYYSFKSGNIPIVVDDTYWLLGANHIKPLIELGGFFMSGTCIYIFRDKIPFSKWIFISLMLLLLFFMKIGYFKYGLLFFLPYITMYLSILPSKIDLRKFGDFSYGSYIYAFPIQQFLINILPIKLSFIWFFVISTIAILIVAIISWYLIEKPFLHLKRKLS